MDGGGTLERHAGVVRRVMQALEGPAGLLADAAGGGAPRSVEGEHCRKHHGAAEPAVIGELRAGARSDGAHRRRPRIRLIMSWRNCSRSRAAAAVLYAAPPLAHKLRTRMSREPGTYAHFTTNRGQLHRQALRRRGAARPSPTSSASPKARRSGRIRAPARSNTPFYDGHHLPPRHRRLHDPGRRSARHRAPAAPATSSRTSSTRSSATTAPASCRWPTPGPTPTAASSSSRSAPRRTSTTATRSSARSSRAWTSSRTSAASRPAARIARSQPVIMEKVTIEKV